MCNLNVLYEAVLMGKLEDAVKATQIAVEEGVSPHEIINQYMIKAMEEIGARFEAGNAFVPNLLMSARAMRGALDVLKPLMQGQAGSYIGKIVIGTVKGDLHDIGKNLVASMFEGCGFEVINLGVDVTSDKFVQSIQDNNADIICMSALLTTTMNYMKEVIAAIESVGLRNKVKIMVGGAPVNGAFAKAIGADAYTSNANAAVIKAKELIGTKCPESYD